ncbi:MAG TPA: metalloregulator ArsR/SmtB family transcription factor [Emticicia sp.]
MRRDVFQAIADPTRREIIGVISKGSLNLNSVAERFDISRPAVSKHIKILTECGLVVIRQRGRERFCEPHLQKLTEVADWVEKYRVFWNSKLDALDIYLTEIQKENKPSIAKNERKRKNGKKR